MRLDERMYANGTRTRRELELDVLVGAMTRPKMLVEARLRLRLSDFADIDWRAVWEMLAMRDPDGFGIFEAAAYFADVHGWHHDECEQLVMRASSWRDDDVDRLLCIARTGVPMASTFRSAR